MNAGTKVGAGRWPYAACHEDCWQMPWSGTLLALDDPRAWVQTIAFPVESPDADAVKAHVARCRLQGLLSDRVPVLWDFGAQGTRCYFETADRVVPYAQDVESWRSALAERRATSAGLRLVKIGSR